MLGIIVIIPPNLFVHSVMSTGPLQSLTTNYYQALFGWPQSEFLEQFDRPTTGVLANFLVVHPM